MDNDASNIRRRQLLVRATASMGGAGLVLAAIPFIRSMDPSEAAMAAGGPVQFDLTALAAGTLATIEWRGRPIWVLHRSPAMLERLDDHDIELADPGSAVEQQPVYARNATRSIAPQFWVGTAICTHLGCVPAFQPDTDRSGLGSAWDGGFYCPCHGSKFDLAGRVYKNVPAPRNLEIPPHRYLAENRLEIGTG